MTTTDNRICSLVMEIQEAFLNTPDLTMSTSDVVRRFGADRMTSEAILCALVDARVLAPAGDDRYESAFPQMHLHPAPSASPHHPAAA
jgi:hypothetical protein